VPHVRLLARRAASVAALALLAAPVHAQPAPAAGPADAVIAAERAFARLSLDSGTYVAFVANLDERSVVFRPRATNGKQWYVAHPPTGPQGTLFWTPAFVGVSSSGDLAFSTGPYRFEGSRGRDTVRAGGVFATVWGRADEKAPWRVLIDLGVGDSVVPSVDPRGPVRVAKPAVKAARGAAPSPLAEVLRVDSALGAHYTLPSSDDGLVTRVADDAWVLRDRWGVVAPDAVRRMVDAIATYTSTPTAGAVARAGDLAYTYGTYTLDRGGAPSGREGGNYLRVWRRDVRGWRLVLDVASPVPPGA
jgi:ketosteroid isomerase-like protein